MGRPRELRDGFDNFLHGVELESLWQSWGQFIYCERSSMWKLRRLRPLWAASVAIGIQDPPVHPGPDLEVMRLREEWLTLCPGSA